jgi:hypothetical protein
MKTREEEKKMKVTTSNVYGCGGSSSNAGGEQGKIELALL